MPDNAAGLRGAIAKLATLDDKGRPLTLTATVRRGRPVALEPSRLWLIVTGPRGGERLRVALPASVLPERQGGSVNAALLAAAGLLRSHGWSPGAWEQVREFGTGTNYSAPVVALPPGTL